MKYNLQIPCCTKKLTEVRKFVYRTLAGLNIPDHEVDMIVLAVDEICANRIIHSNDCNTDKQLSVVIEKKRSKLIFEISDEGTPFNIHEHKEPCIRETVKKSKRGGLGLMLVRKIMDAVEYRNTKTRHTCLLQKKLTL